MEKRKLGKSNIEVSALGLGCWPIGGPFYSNGTNTGYGKQDDNEALKALYKAFDLGISFFDTSDIYGAGHSEKLLGKAFSGMRNNIVIATKFGFVFNEDTKECTGTDHSPEFIRKACENSLRRLRTDYIDLYQFHLGFIPLEEATPVFETLESLKKEGKIREYGWSTDNADSREFMIHKTNAVTIQHQYNLFINSDDIIKDCETYNLASINRSPLAMGILGGKYRLDSKPFGQEDIRGNNIDWNFYFHDGLPNPNLLRQLDDLRCILTDGGRTLVQGALGWLWAKSSQTIPIPGFRTTEQVQELSKALETGPLTADQVSTIDSIAGNIKIVE